MYCVGDRVRIVSSRLNPRPSPNVWNAFGHMDKWLGMEMTIRSASISSYRMEEDQQDQYSCGGWVWTDNMIEGVVDKEDPLTMVLSKEDMRDLLMM